MPAGLADGSPVFYRGVQVGSVKSIRNTSQACWRNWRSVIPICSWPGPTVAQSRPVSLLGGEPRCLISRAIRCPRTLPCPVPMTVDKT